MDANDDGDDDGDGGPGYGVESSRRRGLRRRLDSRLRALAEEAWGHVSGFAGRMEGRWPDIGAGAAIAERIVTLIPEFDGRQSSLKTWATTQAKFAVKDAQRQWCPVGSRRGRQAEAPRTRSLDRPVAGREGDSTHPFVRSYLAIADPEAEWVGRRAAAHLLRGLSCTEFASVWESVVEGRELKDIAAELGLSESRISQIRAGALRRLRETGRTA